MIAMDIRQTTINNIRTLAADTVQKAKSGHPGAPMGMAPMAYAVWMNQMKHNPKDPNWPDRDRFVLSSGHASSLIYCLLHLTGYGLTLDDMKQFRQWGSKTPGHPEYRHTVGVETTTGPLGQGVANAVGFAIAETMLAAHFNRPNFPIVDHRVYAFCGDGCMMEGIASEACSLAGTLKLGKLTLLYDDNEISIEGNTDIAFRENVPARFEAYGWQVIRLKDGNDVDAIITAIEEGKKDERPTLIVCPTKIGFGCPAKEGKSSAHGEPLGPENVAETKKNLGMPADDFCVLPEVYEHVHAQMEKNEKAEAEWNELFVNYCKAYPELAEEWEAWHSTELPDEVALNDALWQWGDKMATRATSGEMINRLAKLLPNLVGGSADLKMATRATSGEMINRLAKLLPNLVGGSADLAPSNKTNIKDGGDYSAENRAGRNLHFGVREHAMAAICNAIALHGGLRVFCGTFFVFSDYMKHAMRMSAIMKLPVTYVLTHDSIGVGEDGATHEPIEQLAGLRAIPDMQVFRPADGKETTAAWLTALTSGLPTCLVLTRQNLPQYENSVCEAMKGGYVLADSEP